MSHLYQTSVLSTFFSPCLNRMLHSFSSSSKYAAIEYIAYLIYIAYIEYIAYRL